MRWDDADKNLVVSLWQQGYDPVQIQTAVNAGLAHRRVNVVRSLGSVILQLEKLGCLPKGSVKARLAWLAKQKPLEFTPKKLARACATVEEFSPKKARDALR